MADITMCRPTNDCPVKETCYRYTAKPNPYWQSLITGEAVDEYGCEMYWEVKTNGQNT